LEIGNDARIEFIYPDRSFYGQSAENLNNTSIALKLIYGETAFFLGGDIEKEVEREILAKGIDLQCGVMKANHHGSDSSNTEEFIKAVGPQYCVISVGKNNSFGLPSRRVENRFLRENCRILRTDQLGTIKFSTDGKKLKFYE